MAPPRRRLVAAAIHVTKAARGGALNSTILFPLALLGSRCPLARSDIGAILQAIIVHRVAIATASSFGCLCWLYLTPTSWAFVRKPNPGIMRHHEDLLKGKRLMKLWTVRPTRYQAKSVDSFPNVSSEEAVPTGGRYSRLGSCMSPRPAFLSSAVSYCHQHRWVYYL